MAFPAAFRRQGLSGAALVALLLFLSVLSLSLGAYHVPFSDVISILSGHVPEGNETAGTVVLSVRFPRVILAIFAGAGLAAAGAAFQALFSNPLATPDTLGVATGASFGAVLAILFNGSPVTIQLSALAFGLVAIAIVWTVSRVRGASPILMIILSGIVVGALFSALVMFVKYAADPQDVLPSVTFWLMGSLTGVKSGMLALGLPFVIAGIAVLYLYRWKLNAMTLPEEEARTLGIAVFRIRAVVIVSATLITASVVSMCGLIGWVGLLVPHMSRMMFGSSNVRVMPASLVIGAIFLLAVDTAARTMSASEIPVSILTALIGAPVFILLLRKTGGVRV